MNTPQQLWTIDLQHIPCTLRGDKVIFTAATADDQSLLYAFTHAGHELWSRTFERAVVSGMARLAERVVLALSSTDLLQGEGLLLAMSDNGAETWRWTGNVQKVSAPAVVADLIYFTADAKTLVCLDAETGAEDQRWPLPAVASTAAPLIVDDVAYMACRGPQVLAYHFDGHVVWQYTHDDAAAWLDQTLALSGDLLVSVSSRGEALVLDRHTGTLKQRVAIGPAGKPLSAPTADGSRMFIGARDGLYVLDVPTGRVEQWLKTERRIEAAPVIANGGVYVTCHDHHLYALDRTTGHELWRWAAAQRIEVPPLVLPDQALLVVADRGGQLTALQLPLTADQLAQAGRWAEAAKAYADAGQPATQAEALTEYARQREKQGDAEQAGLLWEQAAAIFTQLDQPERAQACQHEMLRCWKLPVLSVEIQARDLRVDEWSAVDLTVRNDGFGPAHNIVIHAQGDQFAGRVMETQRLATLSVGRTRTERLDVKPREVGRVPLRLKFEYTDRRGALHILKHTLYVEVARPTVSARSGGVDISGGTITGDVIGRDKLILAGGHVFNVGPGGQLEFNAKAIPKMDAALQPGQAAPPLEVQTLRVDAAVPEQVFVERVFDLAVAVRQMMSPVLAVKDLKHVESGEMQTAWAADTPLINLRAEVEAPECDVIGKSSIQFRLARGKDAPPIYFHLKPRHGGELSIIVTVYQEDYALGSARVSTLAAEQTAPTAGKVQLTVASQPLWLDCELRIFEPSDQRYRVELTLNHEQVFSGAASHELATWIGTQDPAIDGPALFQSLLTAAELRRAWDEARGRSKQRRLRLRIDPPALHALPWELLRDGAEVIAADADTPFSRYLPIGKEWGRPRTDRPIRVLAVIANPSDLTQKYDLPAANVELEEQTLRAAVSHTGQGAESLSLAFLTPPITPARLEAELRHGYHVLHFIGHGALNTKSQQAALYFENDDRTARRVIDADFAGLLDRLQRPPQLVVLAACQSARQSLHEVFSGLAPRLVQIGLPAVVAMQADVSLLTARQFTATFYRQLSAHGTVDLAMNEARSTLITAGRFDAAVPVLFMRLRDGRLWGEAPRAPAPPIEPPPPIGRKPLPPEERESLERQLQSTHENLRLIEERKAEYVLGVDVPVQLIKEERRLRAKIAELEDKLRGAN